MVIVIFMNGILAYSIINKMFPVSLWICLIAECPYTYVIYNKLVIVMYFQKTGKQEQEEKLYEMQEKNVTRQQRK